MIPFRPNSRNTPRGKPGERVYAIGDIHGCLLETKALLKKIKLHNDYSDAAQTHLIFLGDLIDRGPNSRGVIEFLLNFPYDFAKPLIIMGNHEEMMVRGLTSEPGVLPDWLKFGGFACAESYGLTRGQLTGHDPLELQRLLRSVIPRRHVEFVSGFLDYIKFGDYLFTHAGIKPGVSLENQNSKDLRWIRDPFLSFSGDHGFTVVHGHTVSENIDVLSNRIGLDTGVYQTGRLSAVCIEDERVTFFSTP